MKLADIKTNDYTELILLLGNDPSIETEENYSSETTTFFLEDGTIKLNSMQEMEVEADEFCGEFVFFQNLKTLEEHVDKEMEKSGIILESHHSWGESADDIEENAQGTADLSAAKWLRAAEQRWFELQQ